MCRRHYEWKNYVTHDLIYSLAFIILLLRCRSILRAMKSSDQESALLWEEEDDFNETHKRAHSSRSFHVILEHLVVAFQTTFCWFFLILDFVFKHNIPSRYLWRKIMLRVAFKGISRHQEAFKSNYVVDVCVHVSWKFILLPGIYSHITSAQFERISLFTSLDITSISADVTCDWPCGS